jgi:hypothetical protein
VKRSPKAKIKRKTFEVEGPAAEGAMTMDDRYEDTILYPLVFLIVVVSIILSDWRNAKHHLCRPNFLISSSFSSQITHRIASNLNNVKGERDSGSFSALVVGVHLSCPLWPQPFSCPRNAVGVSK